MNKEEWKPVKGFENCYLISNLGRVRSLSRKRGNQHDYADIILSQSKNKQGYPQVTLKKNSKSTCVRVSRLVALSFIENKNNKPCVHHINHLKEDNRASNLEWVTYSENIKYNYTTGGQIGRTNMKGKFGKDNPASKTVVQLDLNGTKIKEFTGIAEAARSISGSASHIVKVCKGKLKKHKGYKWQYK